MTNCLKSLTNCLKSLEGWERFLEGMSSEETCVPMTAEMLLYHPLVLGLSSCKLVDFSDAGMDSTVTSFGTDNEFRASSCSEGFLLFLRMMQKRVSVLQVLLLSPEILVLEPISQVCPLINTIPTGSQE